MNLIFFSRRQGRARHLDLAHPLTLGLIAVGSCAVLAGVFWTGMQIGQRNVQVIAGGDTTEIVTLKAQLQDRIDGLSLRMGTLNAHLIRLNALGKRLTEMAGIKHSEFDFDRDPPQGGPETSGSGRGAELADLSDNLGTYERRLGLRVAQFTALEGVLLGRQLSAEIRPTGRPINEGYISSYFGERMDPFNGEEAFHKGIDFAADAGADVVAVASGIVIWAAQRDGYGVLVEVSHGNGYVTRYGHNQRALVKIGDTVQRGQAVAVVGSTGRSTGPHVHFEVLRNGLAVNPMSFVGS